MTDTALCYTTFVKIIRSLRASQYLRIRAYGVTGLTAGQPDNNTCSQLIKELGQPRPRAPDTSVSVDQDKAAELTAPTRRWCREKHAWS
jgi:hypothetical protein